MKINTKTNTKNIKSFSQATLIQWGLVVAAVFLTACDEPSSNQSSDQSSNQSSSQATESSTESLAALSTETPKNVLTDAKAIINETTEQVNEAIIENQDKINQALEEGQGALNESINQMNQQLESLSLTIDNHYQFTEEEAAEFTRHIEKLAKQAGQAARTIEEKTQGISEAINKGFQEGYNEGRESSTNQQGNTNQPTE